MQARWLTEVEQQAYYIREFAFASCLAAQKQSDIRMCTPSGKICTLCKFNQQNINFYKVAFWKGNLNVILVFALSVYCRCQENSDVWIEYIMHYGK